MGNSRRIRVRFPKALEANGIIFPVGLKIGKWNELTELDDLSGLEWTRTKSPAAASELYVAALWYASWLPFQKHIFIQIDNSTSPSEDETALFNQLIGNVADVWDIEEHRSIIFNFNDSMAFQVEALISALIFFALLFRWHIQLTSDVCTKGQRISLQDGDAYFFGDALAKACADNMIVSLWHHPLTEPPRSVILATTGTKAPRDEIG